MEKGKLISKGLTAEVYEWGQDKVLKLYYGRFSGDRVNHDAEIENAVHEAGVASPAIFDIIDSEGRKGIIMQRIYGKTMATHVQEEPWNINCFTRQLAALHYKIHQCSAENLPSQKESLASAIEKSSKILGNKLKKVLCYLESLPGGSSVCHGDLHFGNVIVSGTNLIAIDWSSACKGNPMGDIARTCLTIASPAMPIRGIPYTLLIPFMLGKSPVYLAYIDEYTRLSNVSSESIKAWILPIAAARLKENIPGEKKWLMDIIDSQVS